MAGRKRTLTATVATAIGVGLVTIGATAVAVHLRDNASPPGARNGTAGADLESVAPGALVLEARAREVFEAISGTPLQNDASGVLRSWELNGAMALCMDAHGYPDWDWSRGRTIAPTVDPLSASTFFARPLGTPVTETTLEIRAQIRAEESLRTENPDRAETKVIGSCINHTPPASDAQVARASEPPQARELREAWWQLMYDLDTEFGDMDAYQRCLEGAHLSILESSGQPVSELGEVVAGLVPSSKDIPASADADPSTYSAAWRHLVDAEHEVSRADWACRADAYNAHVDDVSAEIAEFADTHADQIEQTRQGWTEIVHEAEELGFDPGTGDLAPRDQAGTDVAGNGPAS